MSCLTNCCTPSYSSRHRWGAHHLGLAHTYGAHAYGSYTLPIHSTSHMTGPRYTHTTYEAAGTETDWVPRTETTMEPVTTYVDKIIPSYKEITEKTEYVTRPVTTTVEEKVVEGAAYTTAHHGYAGYAGYASYGAYGGYGHRWGYGLGCGADASCCLPAPAAAKVEVKEEVKAEAAAASCAKDCCEGQASCNPVCCPPLASYRHSGYTSAYASHLYSPYRHSYGGWRSSYGRAYGCC